MKEAWEFADLIEEIIRKADHWSLARKMFNLQDVTRSAMRGVLLGGDQKTVTYHYNFPVSILQGTDAKPDDVLEWLRTGLSENQTIEILGGDIPTFQICVKITDEQLHADMVEMVEKLLQNPRFKAGGLIHPPAQP